MRRPIPSLGLPALLLALFGFVAAPVHGQEGWTPECPVKDRSIPISGSLALSSVTFYREDFNRHAFCKTTFYVEIDGVKHLVMIENTGYYGKIRLGDGKFREHAFADPDDCSYYRWDLYKVQHNQIYLFLQRLPPRWSAENLEVLTTRAYVLKENEEGMPGWTTWYFDPLTSYKLSDLPPKYPDGTGAERCIIFQTPQDIYEKIKPALRAAP